MTKPLGPSSCNPACGQLCSASFEPKNQASELAKTDRPSLVQLADDYDRRIAHMQTPAHRAAVDKLFAMDGPSLGQLAVVKRVGSA